MAKLAFKTPEEAKEALEAAKKERASAKEELKAWKKENKVKGEDEPEDKKLAKMWTKLNDQVEKKRELVKSIEEYQAANKVKKVRESKYEYPDNATGAEKKKIRASERARIKREAKEAAGGGKKKKEEKGTSTKEKGKDKKDAPKDGEKKSKEERRAERKAEEKKEKVEGKKKED